MFWAERKGIGARIAGKIFMQVSNISRVNSFAEALAILRCWFLTCTNMLVLTKQQGSSGLQFRCSRSAYVECLGMRCRKDMHVWKSSPRMQHCAHARVPWIFQAGVSYWKSVRRDYSNLMCHASSPKWSCWRKQVACGCRVPGPVGRRSFERAVVQCRWSRNGGMMQNFLVDVSV